MSEEEELLCESFMAEREQLRSIHSQYKKHFVYFHFKSSCRVKSSQTTKVASQQRNNCDWYTLYLTTSNIDGEDRGQRIARSMKHRSTSHITMMVAVKKKHRAGEEDKRKSAYGTWISGMEKTRESKT